ncbi:hypothetical protein GCM10007415_42120 [Parapedobacter pyrenivorans]|uniref:Bacteriophage abortive infection AbiH n=1 Tax=Parapedobacter pyrenivorans TaxID=1305674 RepID=A0A917I1R2_9SPHI|nr:AbiH family protein [Parapedobacter pyrenivorans]GGH01571.1 hypothetical protein GCM10007415_42120 [Parapedobacter pyrenivorans]
MNRLILIGNGFDLAHGLKTSYTDFLIWHFGECLNEANDKGVYKDLVMTITNSRKQTVICDGISNTYELVRYLHQQGKGALFEYLKGKGSFHVGRSLIANHYILASNFSNIWKTWISQWCDERWVDIENLYYETLKQHLIQRHQNSQAMVDGANNILEFLRDRLEKYLLTLPAPLPIQAYYNLFMEPIEKKDILIKPYQRSSQNPTDIMFLDFNYTDTLKMYLKDNTLTFRGASNSLNKPKVAHIHGRINDENNPLIFGFGDELDNDYSKLETENLKGVFKFIKSFGYFKTENYHNLIRFIDSSDYQVYIMGHSCGLSDRTMLNMIFEHPQCKSIKIFYHQNEMGNNFTTLTEEISRHFRNKSDMRKKIVPFTRSIPMPQYNQNESLTNAAQ